MSRIMEKNYQDAYGGERPGNDGGTNKFAKKIKGVVPDGKPDVIGALDGYSDIECKMRANAPAFIWDALNCAYLDRPFDAIPLVLLSPKNNDGDLAEQFVIMNRKDFDVTFVPRIREYGSLTAQAEALLAPLRPSFIVVNHRDGTCSHFDYRPRKTKPMDISWAGVAMRKTQRLYVHHISRNIPQYLFDWKAQITKHTNKNLRLPVIAWHPKGKEYKNDHIIIPRVDFDRFFSPLAMRKLSLFSIEQEATPAILAVSAKIVYENGLEGLL